MNTNAIRDRLNSINNKYNADNDCSDNYPTVNWTDRQLTDCIEALVAQVESLSRRISDLEEMHP